MKRIITFLFISLIANIAQAQYYGWAKRIVGTYGFGQDGRSVVTDAQNNSYFVGNFSTTRDFDPGAAVFNLTGDFNRRTGYILKLNTNGNFVWAKQLSTSVANDGCYIKKVVNDSFGNLYITGSFAGTVDFDPSATNNSSVASGGLDMFVAKYDTAGNYIWHKTFTGVGSVTGRSIVVSNAGTAIYITGEYEQSVDFDPDAGTVSLTASAGYDGFVLALNSTGGFNWVKAIPGTSDQMPSNIDIDINGNILIAGVINGTTAFSTGGTMNITSNGLTDGFIAKYANTGGNPIWAKRIGGTNSDAITALKTDVNTDNIYVGGFFKETVDMDPGTGVNNSTALFIAGLGTPADVFVVKLNSNGDFIRKIIHSNNDELSLADLTVDSKNNVYLTGSFNGNCDFGNGLITVAGNGTKYDGYISKFDSAGTFKWAGRNGGAYDDYPTGIVVSDSMDIVTVGVFNFNGPSFTVACNIAETSTSPFSMQNEESVFTLHRQRKPTITGMFANVITYNSFYTHGYINAQKKATTVVVEYGTTTALGSQVSPYNNTNPGWVFAATATNDEALGYISGLQGNTKYYYRINATNEHGTTYTYIDSVTTLAPPTPIINALDTNIFGPFVTNITSTSATIGNYEVQANNLSTSISIEYGLTISYGSTQITSPATASGNAATGITATLTGLVTGVYHYRVKATNSAGTTYSADRTFTIGNPLSLTWNLFEAFLNNKNQAELLWETNNEINTSHFIVEKSLDAKSWFALARIAAIGNSHTTNRYNILDTNVPQGDNYYRIKQADLDGRFTYSAIKKLNRKNTNDITFYPNPSTMKLNIQSGSQEQMTVEIFNSIGQRIINTTLAGSGSVDVHQLPTGTYLLKCSTATQTLTSPIAKQ